MASSLAANGCLHRNTAGRKAVRCSIHLNGVLTSGQEFERPMDSHAFSFYFHSPPSILKDTQMHISSSPRLSKVRFNHVYPFVVFSKLDLQAREEML